MDKEMIKDLKTGCTVWGYTEARAIRKLQREHPDWVDIVTGKELEHILGVEFDGAEQMPYFGAILTAEGRKNLC